MADEPRIPFESADPARAFFGRRKGPALREGQSRGLEERLPLFEISKGDEPFADLKSLFAHPVKTIWLEIGYGGAEHLLHAAKCYPDVGFIGCEMFLNGISKAVRGISELALTNVRLSTQDAGELLPRLPDASCEQVDLFYPDPWPKRRHRKRRFISPERLAHIARVITPQGRFRFASDIDDYVAWTLMHIHQQETLQWHATSAKDWQTPWEDWVRTRYEAKALREGRTPTYLTFEKHR
jgi:tRNA (guanine-N7-)-methyltransferase